jgi:hypothetical protein
MANSKVQYFITSRFTARRSFVRKTGFIRAALFTIRHNYYSPLFDLPFQGEKWLGFSLFPKASPLG